MSTKSCLKEKKNDWKNEVSVGIHDMWDHCWVKNVNWKHEAFLNVDLDTLMPICGDKNNRNVCEIDIDIKCHIAF